MYLLHSVENTTLIVHFAFPASVVPQVVEDTLKSPVVDITISFSVALRLLAKVNVLAALFVPTR